MFNPKNSAYISKYKIMIMISILKWQANPFINVISMFVDKVLFLGKKLKAIHIFSELSI